MAINEFFTVELTPTLTTGNILHSSNIGTGEVLFDWAEFQVPRGTNKLVNITGRVRGKDGAAQRISHELYFAKKNDKSLGTVSSTQAGIQWLPNTLGHVMVDAADHSQRLANVSIYNISQSSTSQSSAAGTGRCLPLILQPDEDSLTPQGFCKLYVGAVSGGGMNFGTNLTASANVLANTTAVSFASGANNVFLPGDIVAGQDGTAIGTVSSVTDTALTITEAIPGEGAVVASGQEIYITNPITLVLQFER